ncbi:hypothetical protein NA57DRAFT_56175 [Rhizodiscina lignyota]|uniref:Uncharacterized protein n=1 Tax=Rhizodiscina lignyota TaxID=1504668 RepID=A0A9P4IF50_9PEZI|nr:hypothetical protein NA57DRAFT_56175 [Rhizodiscina lignyota]
MRFTHILAFWATSALSAHAWTLSQFFDQGCNPSNQDTDPISGSGTMGCQNFGTTPGSFDWEGQDGFELVIFFEPGCGQSNFPAQGFIKSGCENQLGQFGAGSWEVITCAGPGCTA